VTAIGTVVLDLGNVLVRWDPTLPFAGHLTPEQVRQVFADLDFPALNHAQDAGRPWAEARAEVARTHQEHVGALDLYLERFAASLAGPVPGSAALVAELRAAGVRLLGLTNWSAETFHHAVPAAPAIGLLEDVLVSGREGVAKPDPAIFRLLTERYGLDPAGTLFADDSERNVVAAAAEGFVAVLFTTADALRADLVAHGVLPASA
jgi:2-haloacid dehalogenase